MLMQHLHTPPPRPLLRVLVVDEEALIRWSVAETLTDMGCSVIEADDGESALKTLAEAPKSVDVILVDSRVGDAENQPFLSSLRTLAPMSAIVVMTRSSAAEGAEAASDARVSRTISKPFALREVATAVYEAHQGRPQ
jgi:DNA-binding NtrC family response regulator